MPNKKIIIGTRKSRLSLAQTGLVIDKLKKEFPGYSFKIKEIVSSGDKLKTKILSSPGTKGIFVKELEQALINKEIDVAIHSAKDLPVDLPGSLEIGAIFKRQDPRDALISKYNVKFKNLKTNALIATSSPRRRVQLKNLRNDLRFCDIRGNIDTRIEKLDKLNIDAIAVAYVALKRLKIEKKASTIFNFSSILPACGQGALAIEIRKNDYYIKNIVKKINHPDSFLEFQAEKSFLKALGGGCQNEAAVLAKVSNDKLKIEGLINSKKGFIRGSLIADKINSSNIGKRLVKKLKKEAL
jgi:hydroxymethylbilane synthase